MLGDWLVVSQAFMVNPAAAVRGPKHVVTKGATPVLSLAEARRLLELGRTEAAVRQRAWRLRAARPEAADLLVEPDGAPRPLADAGQRGLSEPGRDRPGAARPAVVTSRSASRA